MFIQVLEAAKLPADFTAQEKIRLQFYTYYYFSKYALYHPHFGKDDNYIPSKAYYEKLEAITPINAGLLALKEYKAFLPKNYLCLNLPLIFCLISLQFRKNGKSIVIFPWED